MKDSNPASQTTELSGHHPHKTVPVLVWADIDEGIADFVRHLNTLSGIRTYASCEGGTTYGPQVMVTWEDDAAFMRIAKYPMTRLGHHFGYVHPQRIAYQEDNPNTPNLMTKIINMQERAAAGSQHDYSSVLHEARDAIQRLAASLRRIARGDHAEKYLRSPTGRSPEKSYDDARDDARHTLEKLGL